MQRVQAALLLVLSLFLLSGCLAQNQTGGPDLVAAPQSAEASAETSVPVASRPEAVETAGGDYRIAPRDILQLTVFQVADLTRTVQVDNAGFVSLPLLNNVKLSGLTIRQAQDLLTDRLGKTYLRSPQVSLALVKSGQKVTVNGAVKNPQVITIDGALTLSQAVAQSGGLSEVANSSRIHVARQKAGRVQDEVYDLDQIQAGNATDPSLYGGDIVIAEESNAKVAFKNVKDILPFAAIGAALSDVRVKRDVVPLARLANGLNLYRFRYLWSNTVYVGVMAQEVQKVDPDAVVTGKDGFLRVSYARLGMEMMTCKEWMATRTSSQASISCL